MAKYRFRQVCDRIDELTIDELRACFLALAAAICRDEDIWKRIQQQMTDLAAGDPSLRDEFRERVERGLALFAKKD